MQSWEIVIRRRLAIAVLFFAVVSWRAPPVGAQEAPAGKDISAAVESGDAEPSGDANTDLNADDAELFELDIEALMDIEVEIVSRKKQKVSDSPAAVYVVTQEAIRRGGFKSIPEALRMVPGLNVARINANQWAISIRGFNTRFTNKLLVLIDGRSVYTPTFSGVYWEVQDTLIEDVDRIEVIRGPGGTLWGANAVNGVINIITKSAKDTLGGFAQAGAGSELRSFGSVRYGAKVDDDKFFRVYAKYLNHDDFVFANGNDGFDEW